MVEILIKLNLKNPIIQRRVVALEGKLSCGITKALKNKFKILTKMFSKFEKK